MTNYEQYVAVSKQIDSLETHKELLRKAISDELPEDGYKDEAINAYWTIKKNYKYSPKVEGLNAELKATKKLEEENGTATFEEAKQLTIKLK